MLTGSRDLVLVTGAAGFIGSNVARSLVQSGRRVVGCDRMRHGEKWRNLVDVPLHDLILPEALPTWLARHEGRIGLVIHMGAVSATTETDLDRIVHDNVRTSLDLWEWCAATRTGFIYASSAATYGAGEHGFEDDEAADRLARLRPLNAYGWSKHFVDQRIVADAASGRPTPPYWAGLKLFNVYGPGEDHKGEMRSVVSKLIPVALRREQMRLFRSYRPEYPDGGQKRDFVYVDDVVAVIRWLAETRQVHGLFNLGTGQARTWNDLAASVAAALGRPCAIEYIDMPEHIRPQYQYFTQAPIEKLRRHGWTAPMTTLEAGVARYVEALGLRGDGLALAARCPDHRPVSQPRAAGHSGATQ